MPRNITQFFFQISGWVDAKEGFRYNYYILCVCILKRLANQPIKSKITTNNKLCLLCTFRH